MIDFYNNKVKLGKEKDKWTVNDIIKYGEDLNVNINVLSDLNKDITLESKKGPLISGKGKGYMVMAFIANNKLNFSLFNTIDKVKEIRTGESYEITKDDLANDEMSLWDYIVDFPDISKNFIECLSLNR